MKEIQKGALLYREMVKPYMVIEINGKQYWVKRVLPIKEKNILLLSIQCMKTWKMEDFSMDENTVVFYVETIPLASR